MKDKGEKSKIPILTSNLDHMNFVWECLDIRYGLFDTKRGFYQFAAKANVSGSGCPGSNFILVLWCGTYPARAVQAGVRLPPTLEADKPEYTYIIHL